MVKLTCKFPTIWNVSLLVQNIRPVYLILIGIEQQLSARVL